ncbi:MAG: undecaprenyl-phosphate glucose phosphotransferase [Verrucomicrobia bacterium]|nr:undecaprenyl-phosphate glucose phosphotransferase [Cytophagales bacterium]
MTTRYSRFTRSIYLLGDIGILNVTFLCSHYLIFGRFYPIDFQYIFLLFFFNITWVVTALMMEVYDIHRVSHSKTVIINLLKLLLLHVLLSTAFIVIREKAIYSRNFLLLAYFLMGSAVVIWRLVCLEIFRLYRIAGGNYRRIVIIGYGEIARELKSFFDVNPQYGYRFMGYFDDITTSAGDVKGDINSVKAFALNEGVDEIYCSMTDIDNERLNDLIDFAESNLIRVKIIPDFRGISYRKARLDFYEAFPVLTFREIPLEDALNRFAKRSFDIVFSSLVLLLVCSWLFPLIALAVRIDSAGPVFFRQRRTGKDRKTFWCYKFRSMYVNQEADSKQATKNDCRITRIGTFLRRTSLDEMPQFINVLLGNMSVVGPRPHIQKLDENYEWIERYTERQLVKPGITGLAQVKGYRGETSHPQLMQHRVVMDNFYIEKWSLLLDMKIILMTFGSLLKGDKNAY